MKNNFDFSGYVTKYNVVCSDGRTIAPEAFKDCDGYFGEIDNKEIYFYCPNCGADMRGAE